jgi:poly-beta-1,6-N-acetyl-D-glucosamine synthase
VRARQRVTVSTMRLAVIVSFLDEERFLPTFLESVAQQTRSPERLVLVDDGSRDSSVSIAKGFAATAPYATVLALPRRSVADDRLAGASELRAFQTAVNDLEPVFDLVAKLDADLELPSRFFDEIVRAFEADPGLGLAGAYLSVRGNASTTCRDPCPADHVRGANRFYRWECFEQVSPIPAFLGWDTIDETRAKMRGWRVRSLELPGGDPIHLRPTGSYDGATLRGFRRVGRAAWGYGSHPLGVLAGTASRMRDKPLLLGGIAFFCGWLQAAVRQEPRAEEETRSFFRAQQLQRMARAFRKNSSIAT